MIQKDGFMSVKFYLGVITGVVISAVTMASIMCYCLKDSSSYERTFPDCPTCRNMNGGDCEFKRSCIVELSQDGECRVGSPSNWLPTEDILR